MQKKSKVKNMTKKYKPCLFFCFNRTVIQKPNRYLIPGLTGTGFLHLGFLGFLIKPKNENSAILDFFSFFKIFGRKGQK